MCSGLSTLHTRNSRLNLCSLKNHSVLFFLSSSLSLTIINNKTNQRVLPELMVRSTSSTLCTLTWGHKVLSCIDLGIMSLCCHYRHPECSGHVLLWWLMPHQPPKMDNTYIHRYHFCVIPEDSNWDGSLQTHETNSYM